MTRKSMNDGGLFSPTILGFLIASVVAVFALSVVLSTLDHQDTPFRATTASPSAVGHMGFYNLLERLDLPVAKSRINGTVATGWGGLLIVDEPDRKLMSFAKGSGLVTAPNLLIILPKWSGQPDVFHDGWVEKVTPLDPDVPRQVLAIVDKTAVLVHGPAPAAWTRNTIGAGPVFDGDVQLITKSRLRPLIGTDDKILLGEYNYRTQRVWVLSDPDPLENHGIATSANARFALALVNKARRGNARIVFDETVHGAVAPERNPIQLLFQFPFVIVTSQIIAALALLLLATTSRFGGAEEPLPPFALGKARLIDNIAALMDRAGHQATILRRYLSVKLGDAARSLHAPPGLDDPALARWLDRIGESRGVGLRAATILKGSAIAAGGRSKTLQRLFNDARDMYRWNQELLNREPLNKDIVDGSGGRQDHR